MLVLRTFALWLLLLAFLGQQVSRASGARNKTRGPGKTLTPAPGRAQGSGGEPAASGRGKFTTKDKLQCAWVARDAGDAVRVSVKCENRESRTGLKCDYDAKPQRCPGYRADPTGFWRQVARALKRLRGNVCKDRALVRVAMCKRAPRDAHLKLDAASSAQPGGPEAPAPPPPPPPPPPRSAATAAPTACTRRADHRGRAEQHCGSSWASVCAFFFSMVQSDDC